MAEHVELEQERVEILQAMRTIRRMRRGTVNVQHFVKRKADGSQVRQGPYFLFSRTEKGASFSKRLHPNEVQRFREETENCRRFKDLTQRYILICEELCDEPREGVKKTSDRPSTPK